MEEDPTGGKYAGAGSALNGAAHKLESIIQFHVGDVVTSLQRAVMQPGGQETVLYGTIMGTIGQQCFCCPLLMLLYAGASTSRHGICAANTADSMEATLGPPIS